jgi:peptidyl-dipeptidase A
MKSTHRGGVAFAATLSVIAVLFAFGALGPLSAATPGAKASAAEAQSFLDDAEKKLLDLAIEVGRAQWVQQTYITEDTEMLSAKANEKAIAAAVEYAKQAARFDGVELSAENRRKLDILKFGLVLPAPADPAKTAELAQLAAELDGMYGRGKYCPPGKTGDDCQDIQELSRILATSRDPKALQEAWLGWHSISPPMRPKFERLVEVANEGARELGYSDVGTMWRSRYDLPPAEFSKELDRLWGQVKPLYESLHCYTRAKLNEKYGDAVAPSSGPIPAHLLGNLWAQSWDNLYTVLAPQGADSGIDLDGALKARGTDAQGMVKFGENFFTSLGFAPLPESFWQRSMFTKPRDRDVVCHASAWDLDFEDDLRIKMCIEPTGEDFYTIHHELGHNFYQRAYKGTDFLFRDSANDGFHEAVGDTIALSITPTYLKQLGLISVEPPASKDTGLLLQRALDKVAFLPFGLMIDQWRWKVFNGEVKPDHYNQAWWDLKKKYQGVAPPVARTEAEFDPGAKYHVPGNVPYTRYFLADILQFQMHRGLCKAAGQTGPLHRCSIYGNKAAGERLQKMLEMGLEKPWQDALFAVTGEKQMDATAMLDYFAPLKTWLDGENKRLGAKCGW